MWKDAITAIQQSDDLWIDKSRREFREFFRKENKTDRGGLKKQALEHHYDSRLFKMFLGKDYSGLALSLPEGAHWLENATALESNWGWLLAIGVGGAYFADYLNPEIAQKYFLPREALVAGSGKPDGRAEEISSGTFSVSGSWKYCSGCEQASLYTAVTHKPNQISAFVLPLNQAKIKKDWNAVGLPLTGSHSVVAENAEIPGELFFDLITSPRPSEYPISTYPFLLFARACFVPVMIGISRALWTEIEIFVSEKEQTWKEFQPERYAEINRKIGEIKQGLTSGKTEFYKSLEKTWKQHLAGGKISEEGLTEISLNLSKFCYRSVSEIIPILGMPVLERSHPIQKLWQDLQTAYQHMAFHPF